MSEPSTRGAPLTAAGNGCSDSFTQLRAESRICDRLTAQGLTHPEIAGPQARHPRQGQPERCLARSGRTHNRDKFPFADLESDSA